MSLIQEALKRQQEEQGEKPGARPPPIPTEAAQPPPIPTSMPAASASEPVPAAPNPLVPDRPMPALDAGPKRGKLWIALGGVGLFAVVLVVAIAYLFSLLGQKRTPETAAVPPPAAPAAETPSAPPAAVVTEAPPPPVMAAATPSAPVEPVVAPVEPVAPPPAATSAGPTPEPVAAALSIPVAPAAPPPPPPVVWPTLKLTTIMAGAKPGQGAARINGKMVFVGNQVEGVTLVEVKVDGVLLKNGTETRFLRVGGTVL